MIAFQRHTFLPLDDCFYRLQATIPHLIRLSLHRCLQRHGISRLPEVNGDKPAATAGTPSTVIEGVFTSLPADQQLAARTTWARMTTVLRTDALVPLLAATKGQSESDVDAFFRIFAKV